MTEKALGSSYDEKDDDAHDEKLLLYYDKVMEYDEELKKKKSYAFAVPPMIASLVLIFMGHEFIALILFGIAVFMLFSHRIDYVLAKKVLTREYELIFPQWLMELSLLLQTDNVQMAMAKSYDNAPAILKPEIKKMMKKLAVDPTSQEVYLGFLSEFNIEGVSGAMNMLHSLSEGTGGDAAVQIRNIIRKNEKTLAAAETARDDRKLASLMGLFFAPALTGGLKLVVDMAIFLFFTMQSMGSGYVR